MYKKNVYFRRTFIALMAIGTTSFSWHSINLCILQSRAYGSSSQQPYERLSEVSELTISNMVIVVCHCLLFYVSIFASLFYRNGFNRKLYIAMHVRQNFYFCGCNVAIFNIIFMRYTQQPHVHSIICVMFDQLIIWNEYFIS